MKLFHRVVHSFIPVGNFPLSRYALYVASLFSLNSVIDCGATLNVVLGQILYVLVFTGHPSGEPSALASVAVNVPSRLIDCTIPVCPVLVQVFITNRPHT